MKATLTFLFFLFFVQANSQNYKLYTTIIEDTIFSIDDKIAQIDLLLDKELKKDTLTVYFKIIDKYTTWLYRKDRMDKDISVLLASIKNTPPTDKRSLEKRWNKTAYVYRAMGKYKESIPFYEKTIQSNTRDFYYFRALRNISDSYYEIGDYEISRTYYDLSEQEAISRKNYKELVISNALSSNTYSRIDTPEARKEIRRKLLLADSLSQYVELPYTTYYNIKKTLTRSYSYEASRDIPKGLKYINEALAIAHSEKDSIKIINALFSKAELWDIDDPEKSIEILNGAFKYYTPKKTNQKSFIYANLGINKAKIGLLDEAIKDQYTSLEILLGAPVSHNINKDIPALLDIKNSNDNLRTILSNLAQTYYLQYKKSNNTKDIDRSIQFFKYADLIIENYFKSDVSIASKLLWRKEASKIYSRAIQSCYEANDIESALLFIEKSKALFLYKEIATFKASQALNVSDTLLSKKRRLRTQLNRLERAKTTQSDSLKKIIAIQDSLNILSKTITKEYPDYKDINEFALPSLSNIQQQLKDNEAILEYHISVDDGFGIAPNAKTGYGLLITSNKTHLYEINEQDSLKANLDLLLTQLNKKQQQQSDITKHKDLSITIFNKLVPESIRKDIQDKRLTIIPDNYLSTLPFEALISSITNKNTRYFIQDNEIHYVYSAGFEQLIDREENDKEHTLTAFAPVIFNNAPSLSHSLEEVTMLDTYINTNLYTNNQASKNNFLQSLGTSKIIHLATHATIENNDPLIEFSDGSIHLDEINTLPNNAALVTLSACETTTGEIADGEGILSLARGFFYGGAQATLSSLWQVDDKATYAIMEGFYKHLSEGDTKSAALRKAKIAYLNTHSGSEQSPYYWSSFILTGSIDPIVTGNSDWIYYIGIGLFMLGILLFMLSRKRKTTI